MTAPTTPAEALTAATLPPAVRGTKNRAQVLARRTRAVSLRLSGLTYEQVAEHAGYATRAAAYTAVQAALREVQVADVDELRRLESLRLDRLLSAVWQGALRGDVPSVREARRITETRARLLGLNAPLQVEDVTGVDAEIAALRTALAADLVAADADGVFVVTELEATA